jgi:hypothetical protein
MHWGRWLGAAVVALFAAEIRYAGTQLFSFPIAGTIHRAVTGTPVPFTSEMLQELDLSGVQLALVMPVTAWTSQVCSLRLSCQ